MIRTTIIRRILPLLAVGLVLGPCDDDPTGVDDHLEVEGVAAAAARLAAYRIASVLTAEQHPNADRLRVCTVDLGDGSAPVQVVCGAPNARAGMKSVFAPPGTFIPGKGITLGVGVIRGVESAGMLCSEAELELSEDHHGIIDLPQDAPVGTPYAAYAGLDDPVIEINLTPNRPDCASVRGIARDLAAAGLGVLRRPQEPPVEGGFDLETKVVRDLPGEEHLAPAFALRLVRGVRNGPSPAWMQRRLQAPRPDRVGLVFPVQKMAHEVWGAGVRVFACSGSSKC